MKPVILKYFNIFKTSVTYNGSESCLAQFEEERQKTLLQAVQVGACLSVFLVPLFGVLDILVKRDVLAVFWLIRMMVTLIAVLIFFLTKTGFGERRPYILGSFLTFVVGGSIALMCHLHQGPSDPYYAGINLPILGFGILLPLTLFEGVLVFMGVWASYFFPNMVLVNQHNLGIFVSNNFFMLTSILLACVSSQFHLYYLRNEWNSKYQLEKANTKIKNYSKDLEKKVKERTQRLLQSERLAVVGQLAGGIAHDFNNFLTAILGVSDLILRQTDLNPETARDIESIYNAGNRASALVKQLLAFSRQQIYEPKLINLNDIIDEVQKMLSRLIGEDIEMTVQKQDSLGLIMADPVQIEQIVLNLAVNARDAMPEGGSLMIETSQVVLDKEYCQTRHLNLPSGNYVLLAISDTGEGMSEEVKSKIFEPFFTTKRSGKGTGLGLSSVYGIVKQMQGEVHVYSELGMGSTFKIFIPCKPCTKPEIQSRKRRRDILPRGRETVLLVEDEENVRKLTARLLKRQGYKVIEARAGNEALEIAKAYKDQIDLLMTDVVMPKMNGKILAEQLSKIITDLRVLYMSGYTNIFIVNQGILRAGTAFLQKPFTVETLSQKVRTVFDN